MATSEMTRDGFVRTQAGARRSLVCAAALLAACLAAARTAPAQSDPVREADELMRAGKYASAIKVLEKSVQQKGGSGAPTETRLLGECYYLSRDYAQARTAYARALQQQTTDSGRIICEARLAAIAYRLQDFRGAREKIDNFVRAHPSDKHVGTLLVMKMKIVAAEQRPAAQRIAEVEPIYQQIAEDAARFGYYDSVVAAEVLGDLYISVNNDDKAMKLFITAAHRMSGLITQCKTANKPIPRDLMLGFDSMCTRIARYYMRKKNWAEVEKWLGNVGYDPELTRNARLLTAQMALQRNDYDRVAHLLDRDFMATVPEGQQRSAMYLLLGFANRDGRRRDVEQAKECFKQVAAGATGYAQAQHALGDIYRDQNDYTLAAKHYGESVKDPEYAAPAMYFLGLINRHWGERIDAKETARAAERKGFMDAAAKFFSELATRFPLTSYAKQAREQLDQMRGQGLAVPAVAGEDERIKGWEKTVQTKPGTLEAAQALISLARAYAEEVRDEKKTAVVRAPDWAACARVCDILLKQGEQPYQDVSAERWKEYRCTMFFLKGKAELGSLARSAHAEPVRGEKPVPLPGGGDAERAALCFQSAKQLAAGMDKDFLKDLDLSLVEALFKSPRPEERKRAEARYAELRETYGGDPRYQKLALDLADWFVDQNRFDLAADAYYTVSRQPSLNRDQMMQLLYMAGLAYSRAGALAEQGAAQERNSCGLIVCPKSILKEASLIETHKPFQTTKVIVWKPTEQPPTAEDVLRRVSREFGVPFVWSPEEYAGGVASYLKATQIPWDQLAQVRKPRSLQEYLRLALDLQKHRLDFDIGVSGGKPTTAPGEVDKLDGSALLRARAIEIYDPARERFRPLERPYEWGRHNGKVMMYHVVARVEELTGARVQWADAVDKDQALAREFAALPGAQEKGLDPSTASCAAVLRQTLETLDLTFRLARRDYATEMFDKAKSAFNELRQFGTDTKLVEKAMFQLAINYYHQEDFEKMKLVLREYLKLFDNGSYPNYYQACFWLGWAFERDANYREAVKRYLQAAEEAVVLYRRPAAEPLPAREDLRKRLSYETLLSLDVPASGEFKAYGLTDKFAAFIRFNSNVELKFDASAQQVVDPIERPAFRKVPCFDLLYDAMRALELGLRTENADKEVADRAYYRLAVVYKKDNLMHEALEYVNTLLARFPKTPRKVDALKLKLDIHKGLKDYRNVIAAMEALRAAAADVVEAHKLDYETGRVYFDLCDYTNAVGYYRRALNVDQDVGDVVKVREAYAQALAQMPDGAAEAIAQYGELVRQEQDALRLTVDRLMLHQLKDQMGMQALPVEEAEFIQRYEAMPEESFKQLAPSDLARASWIYYASGLSDLRAGKLQAALTKFGAAAKSPDDYLAGEAALKQAEIYLKLGDARKARETYQYVLFSVQSVSATVRATYLLALCHEQLGERDRAIVRLRELVEKYPIGPYAGLARRELAKIDPTFVAPPEPAAAANAGGAANGKGAAAGVTNGAPAGAKAAGGGAGATNAAPAKAAAPAAGAKPAAPAA